LEGSEVLKCLNGEFDHDVPSCEPIEDENGASEYSDCRELRLPLLGCLLSTVFFLDKVILKDFSIRLY